MLSATRWLAALLVLGGLGGCRGAVTARGMKALGPWSDREVVLEGAKPGEDEALAWARVGAAEGMTKAGLAFGKEERPGALVVRIREIAAGEGRDTLLSSPAGFAADKAKVVAAGGATFVGQAAPAGKVRDVAGLVVLGATAPEAVKEVARVRIALELLAPERERPVGGVVWEGWRNLSRKEAAEKAGREAGEALAEEIAGQRDRWVDRRPASEHLLRTPTPLLLEPGEAVVSLEQGLLLHGGVGVKRWLQLDVSAGGWIVPTASGLVHSRRGGTAAVGAAAFGAKLRLADEGRRRPGISLSYDRLVLWGGAIGSGRVEILDMEIDPASPDATSTVAYDVLTLALSKHPVDWLQLGAGGLLVGHGLLSPSEKPFVANELDANGVPLRRGAFVRLVPYLNVEARAGEHFRLLAELVMGDGITLGLRSLLFGSRTFGFARTEGWHARIDTAVRLTGRDDRSTIAVVPWIGVAVYPR